MSLYMYVLKDHPSEIALACIAVIKAGAGSFAASFTAPGCGGQHLICVQQGLSIELHQGLRQLCLLQLNRCNESFEEEPAPS